MNKMIRKISILLPFLVLIMSLLAGCSSTPKPTITFADAGWDSIRFHNAVAGFIADKAFGIQSSETPGTTPITYQGLLSGEIDVYMELWSDNLPSYNTDLAAGKFLALGVNFADNAQGFYVPRYVIEGDAARGIAPMAPNLKTVADLATYRSVFKDPETPSKGRIYGAIPGWEVDKIMYAKYQHYLANDYVYFRPGSESALAAAFTAAIEKGQPVVGYYWEPTWLTGKYDLVLLEDAPYNEKDYYTGTTACPSVQVMVAGSTKLSGKAPDFVGFLKKYRTSSKLTAQALAYMQNTGADLQTTVKWFLRENDDLLNQWLPANKATAVRNALAKG